MAREGCKVLNCSAQKGTANLPNRNPNAAANIFAISGLVMLIDLLWFVAC